jgi:hypothetical protein
MQDELDQVFQNTQKASDFSLILSIKNPSILQVGPLFQNCVPERFQSTYGVFPILNMLMNMELMTQIIVRLT